MQAHKHTGFSLIEILVVVAILGILIAFAIPNLQQAVRNSNDMAAKAYIHHVTKAIEAARDIKTFRLPIVDTCAALTHIPMNPQSVTRCTYEPDFDHDRYTVTVSSVTGKTFHYDGSKTVQLE